MPADVAFHNAPADFADVGDDFIALVGDGYFGFDDDANYLEIILILFAQSRKFISFDYANQYICHTGI